MIVTFILAQALLLRARVETGHAPARQQELAQPALQLLRSHPGSFHALATAADILDSCRASGNLLPEAQLLVGPLSLRVFFLLILSPISPDIAVGSIPYRTCLIRMEQLMFPWQLVRATLDR